MKLQIEIPDKFVLRVITSNKYDRNNQKLDYFSTVQTFGGFDLTTRLTLKSEPTNNDDPNAVRVYLLDIPVGYICREDAAIYSGLINTLNWLEGIGKIKYNATFCNVQPQKMEANKEDKRIYREVGIIIKK